MPDISVGCVSSVLAASRNKIHSKMFIVFQQFLYNDLGAGEQRILHGEVAKVLEQLYVGQKDEIAVQLAHHYSEAKQVDQAIHLPLPSVNLYLILKQTRCRHERN